MELLFIDGISRAFFSLGILNDEAWSTNYLNKQIKFLCHRPVIYISPFVMDSFCKLDKNFIGRSQTPRVQSRK